MTLKNKNSLENKEGSYRMPIVFWLIIGFSVSMVHAENNASTEPVLIEEQVLDQLGSLTLLELAPLSKQEIAERLKSDFHVYIQSEDELFDKYFLSYIYNYFQTMKPNNQTPYHLHVLDESSQHLVSLRSDNQLHFSKNAGDHIITNRFKAVMDALFNQTYTVLPDEIQMTFQYSNELYAQLNETILSSEDIKDFMDRHSGIEFDEDDKIFTHNELLMILKQYLDLPVHIRDNLGLKVIKRMGPGGEMLGQYREASQLIILFDGAFQKEHDDRGEDTFVHELGHALWAGAIWTGLSREAKRSYARLSWQGGQTVSDEFISTYSTTNVKEDFAEHFTEYINNGERLKHQVESKYNWLKEHVFLNVEYTADVAGHLKVFVESEHGDTTPPYFVKAPYESVKIHISVDQSEEDYWKNGFADVKIEVSGLFDDRSEIGSVEILMQSENDYFWLQSPRAFPFCDDTSDPKECVSIDPNQPGLYTWSDSKKLALSYPADYQITQIHLKDKAGNDKVLRSQLGSATVPFPGTRDKVEAAKKEEERQRAIMEARAERTRIAQDREAQRKQSIEDATGLNILNLTETPIRVYSHGDVTAVLDFKECLSITKMERSSLSLESVTGWLDGNSDQFICSNTDEDVSRCWVNETFLIKQDRNGDLYLTDNRNDQLADFRSCVDSPGKVAKQEEDETKAQLKRINERMAGFNLLNFSESTIRMYSNESTLTDLKPKECLSLTEKELSSLTLESVTGWLDGDFDSFICSNTSDDLSSCLVNTTSLVTPNGDGELHLTDDWNDTLADFRSCVDSPGKQMQTEEEKRQIRLKEIDVNTSGLNLFNLSESSINVYQNQEEVLELEPKECVSLTEQELLKLVLKSDGAFFDTLICSNVATALHPLKCNVTATTLVKQNADEEYQLVDYQGEEEVHFSECISLVDTKNKKENTQATESTEEESTEEETETEEEVEKEEDVEKETEEEIEEPDETPPYLIHDLNKAVSVSIKYKRDTFAFMEVEVNGLFDDLSGIKKIKVVMKSEDDWFELVSPSSCLMELTEDNVNKHYRDCIFIDPNEAGRYVYYERESRTYSHPGDYRIHRVTFVDKSNNSVTRSMDDKATTVYFPGRRVLANKRNMREDLEIRTEKNADGDTVAHILTTDMTVFDSDMYLIIVDSESKEELRYEIDIHQLSSLNEHFNSPAVSGKMSLPIIIPKELASRGYRLGWIAFDQDNDDYYVQFSKSNPNAYFDHLSDEGDIVAHPDVDSITMEVLKGQNRRGGDTSIKVTIPIKDIDKGHGEMSGTIRTPTGDRISFSASLRATESGDATVIKTIPLRSRHAEGEYKITHISTMEDYSSAINDRINHGGLRLYRGGQRTNEERLLERKIKTTVTVSPSRSKSG